jgi:predicted phage terminase large subunit-like protein
LHTDSLIERLLANDQWVSRRYRAHRGFNDFSEILWPEQFPEARLRSIRQEMINEGNTDGYSQEMLSESVSAGNEFFKESDFRYFDPEESMGPVLHYIALDLAVSTKAKADWTVATVAAIKPSGHINIVEVIRARQDSVATMEMLFDLEEKYHPESFLTEKGVITQSIGPFIDMEMISRQAFLTIEEIAKSIDKRKAAKSIQGRMRAGGVAFDKDADWFPDFKSELLKFDRGAHDDQVDTMALLGMYLAKAARPQSEEDMKEAIYEDEWRESGHNGRNLTTGY